MNVTKGTIIELEDGKEYYILDEILLNDKRYFYITNINAPEEKDIRFVEYINGKVFDVIDEEIYKKLLLVIYRKNNDGQ